jgi:hypothetical protein
MELIFADGFESGDLSAWGDGTELPSGAVIFLEAQTCPQGWDRLSGQNRLVVGLPAGGQLGATLNDGLSDLWPRSHPHSITGTHSSDSAPPHNHWWSYLAHNAEWRTLAVDGSILSMINWDNGIDNAGSGYYPFASSLETTYNTNNQGSHSHVLDIDTSSLWETSMPPYVQLLVCVKE